MSAPRTFDKTAVIPRTDEFDWRCRWNQCSRGVINVHTVPNYRAALCAKKEYTLIFNYDMTALMYNKVKQYRYLKRVAIEANSFF